jgi:hypothetical protein
MQQLISTITVKSLSTRDVSVGSDLHCSLLFFERHRTIAGTLRFFDAPASGSIYVDVRERAAKPWLRGALFDLRL